MADNKYELQININGQGGESSSDRSSPSTKREKQGIVRKARTRSTSHGMDILANLKNSAGEQAYEKAVASGASVKQASQAKFGAAAGIMAVGQVASNVVSATIGSVGTLTSNEASANMVDNISNVTGRGIGAIASIAAGAQMGGWVGALIMTAIELANVGISYGKNALDLAKQNATKTEETERTRDRLGYISTGYSR